MNYELTGFWLAECRQEDDRLLYSHGKKISKAVSVEENRDISRLVLFADDTLDDVISIMQGATLTLTLNGISDDISKWIFGEDKTVTINQTEETVRTIDTEPFNKRFGLGYIKNETEAVMYLNTRICIPESEEIQTRGLGDGLAPTKLTVDCLTTSDGTYIIQQKFETQAQALQFIIDNLNISDTIVYLYGAYGVAGNLNNNLTPQYATSDVYEPLKYNNGLIAKDGRSSRFTKVTIPFPVAVDVTKYKYISITYESSSNSGTEYGYYGVSFATSTSVMQQGSQTLNPSISGYQSFQQQFHNTSYIDEKGDVQYETATYDINISTVTGMKYIGLVVWESGNSTHFAIHKVEFKEE